MGQSALHPDLEMRLGAMQAKIVKLRRVIEALSVYDKIDEIGKLTVLEQRYHKLCERVQELNRKGPGFFHDMQAAILLIEDDLVANFEHFITRSDHSHASH